jgi:MFS family permease
MVSSLAALQHRNFRLLWFGQLVSLAGSRMQVAAVLWHVSLLVAPGRKGIALGLVGLANLIPILVLSPISGVLADARDRRMLMLVTQACMAILAAALAALTFSGAIALWSIYLLTAMGAAANTFDGPARQALVPNLLPPAHLPNGISLMTIMFQLASVVGPSLAGICIAALGVGWVYVWNAISFSTVIAALLCMRGLQQHAGAGRVKIGHAAAREGLRFVFSSPMIRSTMLVDFFATFFSSATALLPIFAQDILKVGAQRYGWLYAAQSIGALAASLAMARCIDRIERRGRVLLQSVYAYGLTTLVFGLSGSFWLTFLCLAASGAADTVSMVLRNVIRQMETPDRLRGRMTGVNMMFFNGGPQLGEFEAGAVAQWFGPVISVVSGGLGCLAATAIISLRTPALRAYRRQEEAAA